MAELEAGQRVEGDWLVVRDGELICVVANRCPHQSLPLEGGEVADGQFRCPHHGIAFSIATGKITDDRGFQKLDDLEIKEISVREGVVYLCDKGE